MDLRIFQGAADKMDEAELLELTRVFRRKAETRYPLTPQLKPRTYSPTAAEEDGAFLV